MNAVREADYPDPRSLLLSGLILGIEVMTLSRGPGLWFALFLIILLFLTVRDQWKRILAPVGMLSWMLLLTIIIQAVVTPGSVLLELPVVKWQITREGMIIGLLTSVRLISLVVLMGTIAVYITPMDGMRALEKLLSPLRKFKFPVDQISLTFMMALQFVPIMYEEALTLRKSMLARGWSPGKGLIGFIRSWLPLLIPLLISGLRRADEISLSMAGRGYRIGKPRTSMMEWHWSAADSITALAAMLPGLIVLAVYL